MTKRSARTFVCCAVAAVAVGFLGSGRTIAGSGPRARSVEDWPAYRGADRSGVSAEVGLPTEWGTADNVAWKTPIPGRGHSSPIVVGDRIFLTTAVKGGEIPGHGPIDHLFNGQPFLHPDSVDAEFAHQYRVLALDAETGEIVWDRLAHEGAPHDDRHRVGSFASPTAVSDGERVYAYFGTPGVFAYDFDGKLLWRAEVGKIGTLGMGVGTSPVLAGGHLIIQADEEMGDDSYIVGLDPATGREAWRTRRPVQVSWSTPLLVEHAGRDELVANGNEWLIAYDPATGDELWRIEGLHSNAIHEPLSTGNLVVLTAGYPQKVIKAVRLGGSGELSDADHLAWDYGKGTAYVASNLAYAGRIYLLTDNGVLTCLDAATGEVIYEGGRMPVPQRFYASPVAYEGKFLMSGADGDVFVIAAGDEFEVLATNSLEEPIWATPAIAGGRIYIRTLEHLWAIGRP